jgi:integrase
LPYVEIAGFMSELRRQGNDVGLKAQLIAALALEFLILTAARSGELRKALWSEIDGSTWIIPAAHTKLHKEQRVPLAQRALDILASLPRINDFIFAGHRIGQGLGGDAMIEVLRGLPFRASGENELTVHGFRSTFRDWAAERTAFSNEVCEAALAHAVKGKVEAAYRRGDLFEKRTRLMEAWAVYCSTESARAESVVPIRATP